VYGLSTQDLSLAYAQQVARAPADFVYVDMEHSPMDFPALRTFLLAMGDKATLLRKGNAQPDMALLARFAPGPNESEWVVKQALDLGLYGVLFNGVDTPEQAAFVFVPCGIRSCAIRAMPNRRGFAAGRPTMRHGLGE
jgi:4-hydroxy-2-oxoheptanedioate aldolase